MAFLSLRDNFVSIVQLVIAIGFVVATDWNESFAAAGHSSVRCINLGNPSNIYSELLLGDHVLTTDSLGRFNDYLPIIEMGNDNMALKLCVHIQSKNNHISNVAHDISTKSFPGSPQKVIGRSGGQHNNDSGTWVHTETKRVHVKPSIDIPLSEANAKIINERFLPSHYVDIESLNLLPHSPRDLFSLKQHFLRPIQRQLYM